MESDEFLCPGPGDEPGERCEARGSFQELSYRATWQPVTVTSAGEPDDYGSFDYGDDVWVYGVECRECETVWPSYEELQKAARGEEHATGYLPESELFPAREEAP